MPFSMHKFEVPFRHSILIHSIVRLVWFDVNDWCTIKQVDSFNEKISALSFDQAYKGETYGVRAGRRI